MDDRGTLQLLEELAERLGIRVLYESLTVYGSFRIGGYCLLRGQEYLIINKKASVQEKIQVLTYNLKRCDLSEIYLVPALRKFLDNPDE